MATDLVTQLGRWSLGDFGGLQKDVGEERNVIAEA